MSPPAFPLARRTAQGIVVVDERLVRVACRWTDLTSRDGERVEIEWAGQVGCVDTPADRQVLAERLLGAEDATLEASGVARLLVDEIRPTLARSISTTDAPALLDGSRDAELLAAIEAQGRRAGFAAGLRFAGPFTLRVDSPSVRRARDAERARRQLDAVAADQAARSAAVDELRGALADGDDRSRAVRAASRRVDVRNLLRAVADADARWRDATPTLWVAAGDRLIGVDPTRPDLSSPPIVIDGIGPLRSGRATQPDVEGFDAIAVGGKGGVAIVSVRGIDGDPGRVTRTFSIAAGGDDFGFNAVVAHHASHSIIATHRSLGLVSWRYRGPAGEPDRVDLGPAGGRSIVALTDATAIALGGDGRLLRIAGDGVPTPIHSGAAPIVDLAALGDGRLAIADVERYVAILDADGTSIARTRVASPIVGIAGVDLCGVPRVLVAHDDGTLTLVDVETGMTTPLGDGRWPARAIRARPGFAALLSVDRMRVGLLDLSRPDAAIVELHVHAQLGRRAADLWFA